jgi:hypothetical protein
LATEFRAKMEKYCSSLKGPYGLSLSREFPDGCCHDTSLLLARYLREYGVQDISCVLSVQHAGLLVGDWFVDITGDQFGEGFLQVEVVERSDARYRHMIHKMGSRRVSADYRQYDPELVSLFDARMRKS